MERKTVQETIDKIKSDKNIYTTSSQKDEVSVMRAMLNDDTYHIDLYNNKGCDRLYNMALETKDMISKVVSSQCNISLDQAKRMVNGYEFDNEDAKTMISASKNFVTTYLKTGRKLAFDATRDTEIALSQKHVPEHTVFHPVKINHSDGSSETVIRETKVGAYEQVKAYSKCPTWRRNAEKNGEDAESYKPYPESYDGVDYYSQFRKNTEYDSNGRRIVMEFRK
jgi:hypothetical protein